VPIEGDQIDLAMAGAGVALDDGEAESFEVLARQALAETTEDAAGVLAWGARGGLWGWVGRGGLHDRL
jgi:hypothetical protein